MFFSLTCLIIPKEEFIYNNIVRKILQIAPNREPLKTLPRITSIGNRRWTNDVPCSATTKLVEAKHVDHFFHTYTAWNILQIYICIEFMHYNL